MRIDILTLFPEMYESPLGHSILKRARENGVVDIALTDIRDFAADKYRKVDDKPYGGGPGMVMMPAPVFDCFEHVQKLSPEKGRVILLTPQGQKFDQQKAVELSKEDRLILIAGRYEGFDERIRIGLGAEQVSIGDYVLSGGELAAMIVVDAVVRLLPGALGDEEWHEGPRHSLVRRPRQNRPVATPKGPRTHRKMASGPPRGQQPVRICLSPQQQVVNIHGRYLLEYKRR
jgi:tRNA (guanine37-N1)-methyltransferase